MAETSRDSLSAAEGDDMDGKRRQRREYMGKQGKIEEKGKQDREPGQHKGAGGAADKQFRQGLFLCIYGEDQQDAG